MSAARKYTMLILGALAAVMVVVQLVLGQLLLSGQKDLLKAHQHSGYTTVALAVVYVGFSLWTIASIPTKPKT